MRELEEQELEQVMGGLGLIPNPALFPYGVGGIRSDVFGNFVESQMNNINVRQSINPGELTS